MYTPAAHLLQDNTLLFKNMFFRQVELIEFNYILLSVLIVIANQ